VVIRSASSSGTPDEFDQSAFLFISMMGKLRKISIDFILPARSTTSDVSESP